MAEHVCAISLKGGRDPTEAAVAHLEALLKAGTLQAILVPRRSADGRTYAHVLVTAPAGLRGADPFAPVMPASCATALSRLTKLEAPKGRVGVVMRPCEIAAAIELAKLLQVRFDNIAVIGIDCHGTTSVQDHIAMVEAGKDTKAAIISDIGLHREACRTCDWVEPQHRDMLLGLFSEASGHLVVAAEDERLLAGLPEAPKDAVAARETRVKQVAERRAKARAEVFHEVDTNLQGTRAFSAHFGTCIVCHNCMDQCPVCYCNECFFESQTFRYEAEKMLRWAGTKGGLDMPTDKHIFHLGRMGHMVATCVACGMCTQACPVDINVGRVFKYVASQVQPMFDYKAGRSLKDPLPQATYLEDELEPR